MLYVYLGTADATNITSTAENEEHSQIIIHCTPSTGMPSLYRHRFLLETRVRQIYLKLFGMSVVSVPGMGRDDPARFADSRRGLLCLQIRQLLTNLKSTPVESEPACSQGPLHEGYTH